MDPSGCEKGKVTDLVLVHPNDAQFCDTDFASVAALAVFVALARTVLLGWNFLIYVALRKKQREHFHKQRGGVASRGNNAKSNAHERIPFTLVFESLSTFFLILFVILGLSNNIESEDGSALVLYMLIFIPYELGTFLSIVKMVHLSKRMVLKTIGSKSGKPNGATNAFSSTTSRKREGEFHSSQNLNLDSTQEQPPQQYQKQYQKQQQESSPPSSPGDDAVDRSAASALKKLSEIKGNLILQTLMTLAALTIFAQIIILIVGGALSFDTNAQIWTKLSMTTLGASVALLIILVVYHSLNTIRVVKTSLKNAPSKAVVTKINRLVSRLWLRALLNFVGLFTVPVVMILQGFQVVPLQLPHALIHPSLMVLASFLALLIYKPPTCSNAQTRGVCSSICSVCCCCPSGSKEQVIHDHTESSPAKTQEALASRANNEESTTRVGNSTTELSPATNA